MTNLRRLLLLPALVLAAALAPQALACGSSPYTYAGVGGPSLAYGVAAMVTPGSTGMNVVAGHIAGWVGLGGPGEGPNGTDEWIQVGFSSFPLLTGNDIYYEVTRPGGSPTYHLVDSDVPSGQGARIAVLEMHARPGWWRVWVNRRPVSSPIFLRGSHGRWHPIVTAESWDAGTRSCNDFVYQFARINVAQSPGGDWQPLNHTQQIVDASTRVVRNASNGFLAAGGPHGLRLLAAARNRP